MKVSTAISYLLGGSGPVPVPDADRLAMTPGDRVGAPPARPISGVPGSPPLGSPLSAHHAGSAGETHHPTQVISTVGSLGSAGSRSRRRRVRPASLRRCAARLPLGPGLDAEIPRKRVCSTQPTLVSAGTPSLGLEHGRSQPTASESGICQEPSQGRAFGAVGAEVHESAHVRARHSRMSIKAASRSRSTYGSPLTSIATRLILPPVNR